ncbi:MAG: SHOCT domain-containing protein [Gammaproteobacteria bacterium]
MRRLIGALITLLLPMLWATPSLAQGYGERDFWWHPAWGWGHMIFGGLMMIVFWGGIIVLIVLLVRWLGGAGASSHTSSSATRRTALEILQERFAKGEIDKEEYEERRKLLSD